jgi:UDPglucose 6-dehydrogenase
VAKGMGLDSRIGPKFLSAGPGYGGSCFPKDTRAIAQIFREQGLSFRIIEAVLEANEHVQRRMIAKVETALSELSGGLSGEKTVGVLGLSFKPNTDDTRESPALPIVQGLLDRGVTVRAFDPEAMSAFRQSFPAITYCENAYEAAHGADALVIVTEWNQFRKLEIDRLHQLLRRPLIIDLRNLYEPEKMAAAGFDYISIGRPEGRGASAGSGNVVAMPDAEARTAGIRS